MIQSMHIGPNQYLCKLQKPKIIVNTQIYGPDTYVSVIQYLFCLKCRIDIDYTFFS